MAKYLVNHGGVVHSVNDEDWATALGNASMKPSDANPAGSPARVATLEEITAFWAAQGLVYDPETDEAHPGAPAAKKVSR